MADWNPKEGSTPLTHRKRRVILHGLRDETTVSYRVVDHGTRDFVMAAPVGATREEAWKLAEASGLYVAGYEEEDG